jgi:hypothetical protein
MISTVGNVASTTSKDPYIDQLVISNDPVRDLSGHIVAQGIGNYPG